ncbi:MAG: hypothetical protein WCK35_06560 [Chloroflexota bacterium]
MSGILTLLVGLMGITILFAQMMNGAVVAAIMALVSIQVAHTAGGCPRMLGMGVALATSLPALLLSGSSNVLVMGPGGYKFGDYIKVGFLLTLIIFVVILIFLPKFWSIG